MNSTEAPIYTYLNTCGIIPEMYPMHFTVPMIITGYGLRAVYEWNYERM